MARISPLRAQHEQAGAPAICWGPPEADVQVVEAFGAIESEYGAIRAGCALLDCPHRGAIRVTGADRIEFLNRMLTQQVADVAPGDVRFSFWLNRQGRIEADLRIGHYADETDFDLDVHAAPGVAATLSEYLFTEDVRIEDISEQTHRLALLGPGAAETLGRAMDLEDAEIGPGRATIGRCAGAPVRIEREDSAAAGGFVLLTPVPDAPAVYRTLTEAGAAAIGWHAWNVARIEAGWPVFNIDFGPKNLPAETGLLDQRVSFTKGCYLGQEVVARMHSRGKSRQRLCALAPAQLKGADRLSIPQPISGAQVFVAGDVGGETVGVVTSSTISPALGSAPICFAMLRGGSTDPGTAVDVSAEGGAARMVVRDSLRFV
ncbi:MAG: YgfZ/GcvT domain-containing protein [Phycisphaerales bacterium JB039]